MEKEENNKKTIKFVCVSDTHNRLGEAWEKGLIPEGDVLLHAGDFTKSGQLGEIKSFNNQLAILPHPIKIIIAGNHDRKFEEQPKEAETLLTDCIYLLDQEYIVSGIRIYGSPWQVSFYFSSFL